MLLENQFNEIEQLFTNADVISERVSKASIGWHIDHSLKVIISVAIAIQKSDPATYKKSFNYLRTVFFLLEWFPRGKGKSPKAVRSYEPVLLSDLISQLKTAKKEVSKIPDLNTNNHFKHPLFGMLNLKQTQKFLRMHTEHHLKICRDILN